jgi:hypothetical protein
MVIAAASAAGPRAPAALDRAGTVVFLDAAQPSDRKKWLDLWAAWPRREIMAHPDYVRLFARPGDRAVAAVLRSPAGGILYPVIIRPLAAEPWSEPGARGCDLTTAYGYGGPFQWGATDRDAREFWTEFDAWAAGVGATSSFARLSLFSDTLLPWNGDVVPGGPNVVVRVDVPGNALWNGYRSEARRLVGIARERNVAIEFDPAGKRLDEFLAVYTSTMIRRGASKGYYFPRSFFESFIQDLAGHFTFVHALAGDGRVISSEIVLLSAEHAYSYLGGTLAEAFALAPNYLIKHESFLWCRHQGRKAVVLGGGYQSGDGILRYKQRFTRAGDRPFLLGRRIYDAEASRRLVERRRQWERGQGRDWSPPAEFFPAYRA